MGETMSNKPLTCATILLSHDKKDILIGKITLQSKYDLPKGKLEENETEIEAASRELQEETGLSVSVDNYQSYSQYALYNMFFNKEKNISLFFLYDKDNQLISDENMANLKCHSDFEYHQKMYPEIESFKKINIHETIDNLEHAETIFNKSMAKVLCSKVFKKRLSKFINELS